MTPRRKPSRTRAEIMREARRQVETDWQTMAERQAVDAAESRGLVERDRKRR